MHVVDSQSQHFRPISLHWKVLSLAVRFASGKPPYSSQKLLLIYQFSKPCALKFGFPPPILWEGLFVSSQQLVGIVASFPKLSVCIATPFHTARPGIQTL